MKTKLITRILVACTLAAGLSSSPFLAAATVTYVVDTNLSSVALSGTVSALGITAALNEQSPGSLTAIYGGTLIANVESGSIQFVGGNQLTPLENKSLQPGPGGVAGSAPASYGGKATASLGFFGKVDALVASRQIAFDVSSAPVPLTGTTFQAKSIDYKFIAVNNPVVDYLVSGTLKANGSRALGGLLTNGVSTSGSLAGGILTIPVDASYTFLTQASGQDVEFTLKFKGTLVAKEGTAPVGPVVNFAPFVPGAPFKLSWSGSYKLQRATTLSPPDWKDFPTTSPVEIPTIKPGEYFQVVPK